MGLRRSRGHLIHLLTGSQIGTNGTVTNGAVNFAQICVNFAKTISQSCANFAHILRKSGQFRANSANFVCFRIFCYLHPRLLHPRLFRSNIRENHMGSGSFQTCFQLSDSRSGAISRLPKRSAARPSSSAHIVRDLCSQDLP